MCKQSTQATWTAPGSSTNTNYGIDIMLHHLVDGLIYDGLPNLFSEDSMSTPRELIIGK